jgi:hypothetical protein
VLFVGHGTMEVNIVENTKTTERGGVNQLFMSLNFFFFFYLLNIINLPSSDHQQHTTYG